MSEQGFRVTKFEKQTLVVVVTGRGPSADDVQTPAMASVAGTTLDAAGLGRGAGYHKARLGLLPNS